APGSGVVPGLTPRAPAKPPVGGEQPEPARPGMTRGRRSASLSAPYRERATLLVIRAPQGCRAAGATSRKPRRQRTETPGLGRADLPQITPGPGVLTWPN